jgi:RNA polymerase sigma-70 factor (ECF subfamily)
MYHNTLVADRRLLDDMARGSAEALRTLYRRHGNTVYALAYGIVVDPADANEVVAETFLYAWEAAAGFVPTARQSVCGWLCDIARSRAWGLQLARAWPERRGPTAEPNGPIMILEEVG